MSKSPKSELRKEWEKGLLIIKRVAKLRPHLNYRWGLFDAYKRKI